MVLEYILNVPKLSPLSHFSLSDINKLFWATYIVVRGMQSKCLRNIFWQTFATSPTQKRDAQTLHFHFDFILPKTNNFPPTFSAPLSPQKTFPKGSQLDQRNNRSAKSRKRAARRIGLVSG